MAARLSDSEIEGLYRQLSNSRLDVITREQMIDESQTVPFVATLDDAISLVRVFANFVPPHDREKILATAEQVLTQQPEAAGRLAGWALQNAASAKMTAFYDAYTDEKFNRSLMPRLTPFVMEVNDPTARRRSKGTIVFVARTAFLLIAREALYLRRNGFRVFLVLIGGIPPGLSQTFAESFDGIFPNIGNPEFLRRVINTLEPDIFHSQCWMFEYHIGRMVAENKRQAKCVCEFYDITSIYADREELVRVWQSRIVDLDLASEAWIFRHADAIVHRFPEPVIDEKMREYGANAPQLEMHQYPCQEYIAYSPEKQSDKDGIIHLVYAGGLVPRTDQHPEALFPERNHAEAFRKLLNQGFAIDLFTSPFRSTAESGLDALHDLTREFPLFRFLPGVSPAELSKAIGGYDFGLILTDMDLSKNRNTRHQLKSAAGTKMLTYAEAGIPVIVNAEYEYMTEIIEKHGIGFGLRSEDIATAAERIRSFDRAKARENIKRFNDAHGMDKEIHRLIGLYNRVLDR